MPRSNLKTHWFVSLAVMLLSNVSGGVSRHLWIVGAASKTEMFKKYVIFVIEITLKVVLMPIVYQPVARTDNNGI